MIIGASVHLVFAIKGKTANENTWTIALTAVLAGAGLIFAGDAGASVPPGGSSTSPETPNGNAGQKLGLILMVLMPAVLLGCASFSTNLFNSEKLLADSAVSSVYAYKLYYDAQTNGASPEQIAILTTNLNEVYTASRDLSLTLTAVEGMRQNYNLNNTPTNKTQLVLIYEAAASQSSNIVALVRQLMTPQH